MRRPLAILREAPVAAIGGGVPSRTASGSSESDRPASDSLRWDSPSGRSLGLARLDSAALDSPALDRPAWVHPIRPRLPDAWLVGGNNDSE